MTFYQRIVEQHEVASVLLAIGIAQG